MRLTFWCSLCDAQHFVKVFAHFFQLLRIRKMQFFCSNHEKNVAKSGEVPEERAGKTCNTATEIVLKVHNAMENKFPISSTDNGT